MSAGERAAPVAVVRALADDAIAPLGMSVVDVTITPAGKRRVVRISVDIDVLALTGALDGGDPSSVIEPITLDEVGEASLAISAAMDEQEPLGEAPYVLEVTSPGTDRQLTEPAHFRRNVGRIVTVNTTGGTNVTGRVLAVTADHLTLADDVTIALVDVLRGKVQIEFSREDSTELEDN